MLVATRERPRTVKKKTRCGLNENKYFKKKKKKDDGARHVIRDDHDGFVRTPFSLPSDPGWPLASDALHLPDPGPPAAAHCRRGQPPSCLIREAVPPRSWTCVLPLTSDLLAPLGLEEEGRGERGKGRVPRGRWAQERQLTCPGILEQTPAVVCPVEEAEG